MILFFKYVVLEFRYNSVFLFLFFSSFFFFFAESMRLYHFQSYIRCTCSINMYLPDCMCVLKCTLMIAA